MSEFFKLKVEQMASKNADLMKEIREKDAKLHTLRDDIEHLQTKVAKHKCKSKMFEKKV